MRKISVFIDTSLCFNEVKHLLPSGAHINGAAKKGSILKCINELYTDIVIIDGSFDWTPSVLHKEILVALELGIKVIGGVSIGALRAMELSKFGMIGFGRIYKGRRDGRPSGTVQASFESAVSLTAGCPRPLYLFIHGHRRGGAGGKGRCGRTCPVPE